MDLTTFSLDRKFHFLSALLVGATFCACSSDSATSKPIRTAEDSSTFDDVESCFSPEQNLSSAYQEGAVGCACENAPSQCIDGVALICEDGAWIAVEDGPCSPQPQLSCPPGAEVFDPDNDCPEGMSCWDQSAELSCQIAEFSAEQCRAAGGEVTYDPGDGSLLRKGCETETLGVVVPGGIEGASCCKAEGNHCDAQDAQMVGGCEPAPLFFWDGAACVGQNGCSCEGADCDAGFASQEACQEAYSACGGKICGGFAGSTCGVDEYCAYEAGQHCGAADASAVCKLRPDACTKELNPVCGCDSKTYSNPCTAHAAGTGIPSQGACDAE